MPYGERYIWGATAGMLKNLQFVLDRRRRLTAGIGATSMRVVLLVLMLVMAPTAAFFLWAWAVKIKQERKLAGTLPAVAGHADHLARHRGPASAPSPASS